MQSVIRWAGVLAAGLAVGVQAGGAVLRPPAVSSVLPGGTVWQAASLGRATLTLEALFRDQRIHAFARVSGDTRRGDRVWLDWTVDGGETWVALGPARAAGRGGPAVSAAQRQTDDPSWLLRACGRVDGVTGCTQWR